MSQYDNLKATIALNVYQNHNNEVTANMVKAAMDAMTDSLGAGYQYLGVATPATAPGTPDQKVFYIAPPGEYPNFGTGITVAEGEVAVLKWDTAWHKEVTGAATSAQVTELGQKCEILDSIDDEPTAGSDNLVKSNGGLNKIFEITEDLFANSEYGKYFNEYGVELSAPNVTLTPHIYGMAGKTIIVQSNNGSVLCPIASYDQNGTFISLLGESTNGSTLKQSVVIPDNVHSIRLFSFTKWNNTIVNYFAKIDEITPINESIEELRDVIIKPELFSKFGTPGYYFDALGRYLPLSGEWEATELIPVEISGTVIHLKLLLGNSRIAVACYGAGGQDDFIKTITVTGTPSSIHEGMYDVDENVYIDDVNCKYVRIQSATNNGYTPTAQAVEASEDTPEYIIVSATDADAKYTSLYDLLVNESAGDKKIYLPDSEYLITTSRKLDIKRGWELYGKGIDATNIVYTASDPNFDINWLDVVGSSKLHDLTIINKYPSSANITNVGYCLHIDSDIPNLVFECERVRLMTDTSDRNEEDTNGLVLGIGTWPTQKLTFRDCVFETNVKYGGTGILNYHNVENSGDIPGITVFDGCVFGISGSSFHILDRGVVGQVKEDLIVKNCVIKSFVTFENLNGAQHNSYNMIWSGTKFYGITGYGGMTFPSLESYNSLSLPECDQIDFLENISASTIAAGRMVTKSRTLISGSWHYDEPGMVVAGISEAGADDSIDGVSLVTINGGDKGHILNKGVIRVNGYTIDSEVSAGDYIKLSANSTIVKAALNTNIIYLGNNFIELL